MEGLSPGLPGDAVRDCDAVDLMDLPSTGLDALTGSSARKSGTVVPADASPPGAGCGSTFTLLLRFARVDPLRRRPRDFGLLPRFTVPRRLFIDKDEEEEKEDEEEHEAEEEKGEAAEEEENAGEDKDEPMSTLPSVAFPLSLKYG